MTTCHALPDKPLTTPAAAQGRRRIALLGMPNTGKSTFFNRLTGAQARVGNWPGITIDLLSARLILGAQVAEIVDLPGIYDLHGYSDDERVVQTFLTTQSVDLIVLVINSVQIERQLQLALQLRQLQMNTLVLLNMQDEASKLGMQIDIGRLSTALQAPVAMMSAKQGTGLAQVSQLIAQRMNEANRRPAMLEIDQLRPVSLDDIREITRQTVEMPAVASRGLTERIDRVLLHPVWGLPLFFLILFGLFQAVYLLGSPVQELLDGAQGTFKDAVLTPALSGVPEWLSSFLLGGLWDGLMTVATFIPIIIIFFWFIAIIEDTGYFSRVAYLMDNFMSRLGLDGRSFVMVLMGFGCNVPALMGTRVMRSRGARLLSMLIIPFSLCSARLQVFVFMIGLLFAPRHAGAVLFSLYVMSIVAAVLTALVFKQRYRNDEPFVLELPPYRLPTARMLILRSWHEVRHFVRRAATFITVGVVAVWLLTHLPWGVPVAGEASFAGMLGSVLHPIFEPIGIDVKLTIALVFGFIAKEIVVGALAVIYGLGDTASEALIGNQIVQTIDWVQAYSFMLFTLIYTPCLSTLATLKSEAKSSRFMWISLIWSLGLAWAVSFIFYQTARALGF